VVGRSGQFEVRDDRLHLPDGTEASYTVIVSPDSAFVVPCFANGDTVLVRQWRHAWDESSWEVPAGTFDAGEDPLECAARELAEETGLAAGHLEALGVVHGAAVITGRAHLFLARDLRESERHPEPYEQDMEMLRLPFKEAFEAALDGTIAHAGSVTVLVRVARRLGLI
jgi:ADP-ribose pyrophosphatase